jgi:hypothetical protein
VGKVTGWVAEACSFGCRCRAPPLDRDAWEQLLAEPL